MSSTDRDLLASLTDMTRSLLAAGWRSGIQYLLNRAVREGFAHSAALHALTERGELERMVWVGSSDEAAPPPEEVTVPGVRAALNRERAVVEEEEQRCHIPLWDRGDPIGVVSFCGTQPGLPLTFLEGLAYVAGLILAAQRAFEQQAVLSATDGLTGLYNHRHFQQILGAALGQAYLQGTPLHLILFDIDHFKQINDTYGHLLGDLVLREVANAARRTLPGDAVVARYGGEEFAVILTGVSAEEAAQWAEKLRVAVAETATVDYPTGTQVQVTISLGVATYQLGQGKSRFVARADEALYASKAAGRNRLTIAPADPPPSTALPST